MQVVAFSGSPRKNANSSMLLQELLRGARAAGDGVEEFDANDLQLHYCRGCLRCNMIKRCSLRGDDWETVSRSILCADRLVFASPVYFHHVSAQLKKVVDRFRSFLNVRITETGLEHRPWHTWQKEFILLLTMGSSDLHDARPVIDLFRFMTEVLGTGNRLTVITATRLAVPRQIAMSHEELTALYTALQLPERLAAQDCARNRQLLRDCYNLGNASVQNSA